MIEKLPEEILAVISHNQQLERYLGSLSETVPHTKRSWLYESLEPDDVLNEWMNHLDRLQQGDTFEKEVFQFDTSQIEKWGPQGGHPPVQEVLQSVVLPTFESNSPYFQLGTDKVWNKSLLTVQAGWMKVCGQRTLRPASYKHVVDDMRARDTLESNSGFPDFTRRNNPAVVNRAIAAAQSGEWDRYPAILLFRNYNNKLRMVWMFPMAANLEEGSYFQPLQSAMINAKRSFYAPWTGFEAVRSLVDQAYKSGLYVAASDFSATDEHFQWEATNEVESCLQRVFQQRYTQGFMYTLQRMHQIPLIISPTEWITGDHGVSSGSNWTNFVETVFDEIFAGYVQRSGGYSGLYAIGDDMAWVSKRYDPDFQTKLAEMGLLAGQEIKADKTNNYPDKVKSLQRLFQRGYNRPDGIIRAVYPTIRALKSSIYPERFHKPKLWNSDMFCARQYMILENCVDHPLFEDFVQFVVKGQRDLIPFAKKSSSELREITRKSKLIPGLNTTYNQEKRDSSLEFFQSIQYARTL